MKYNKEAIEAYINNDIKKLEEYSAKKEPIIVLLEHIEKGRFYNTACSLARISYSVFRSWKQRKKAFSAAVELADAKAIDLAHQKIQDLGDNKPDWKAWAYLLSVKDKRYREEQKVEVDGEIREKTIVEMPPMENK